MKTFRYIYQRNTAAPRSTRPIPTIKSATVSADGKSSIWL